jgi:hypothetical protein
MKEKMMSNEIVHDNSVADSEASPLGDRPLRRSRKRLLPLLLLSLGVVILAGGGIGLVNLLHSQQPTASATPASARKVGQQSLPQGCTPARIPRNVVAQDAANSLHLTVDQVKAQVHAGKSFAQIATARGITEQQLRALEINALQQANNYWFGLGCITQQDVASNMQRDVGDTAFMDAEFTDMFR